MKWLLYNFLFGIVYMVMLPSFLIRMKRRGGYRARMGDRFGRYPKEVLGALCLVPSAEDEKVLGAKCLVPSAAELKCNDQRESNAPGTKHQALGTKHQAPIWIHAVSVGEVAVAGQLMRAMRAKDPSVRFVFSTTSSTGWKQAEGQVGPGDTLIYNPLDFGGCVRRALDAVKPRAIILTESEIWPNFIRAAKKRGTPLFLINARVSDRSAPRYRKLRWFFGEVLRCFTKIFAQSDLDAKRLVDAGADPATVSVTGSFKFDVAKRNPPKEEELRAWIGGGEILLGGSTWPGEDEALLRIYAELAKTRPDVKLVIAPRHFEKSDAVEANIRKAGFGCIRRSKDKVLGAECLVLSAELKCDDQRESNAPSTKHQALGTKHQAPVFLCDTTGEMMGLFGIATVAFVGKSLCEHGSQNMIEPCLCGVPTLVGPYTENFRPVMSDLLAADAILQVPDEEALKREMLRLFGDPAARAALGARAKAAVERRRGVVDRCAEELLLLQNR